MIGFHSEAERGFYELSSFGPEYQFVPSLTGSSLLVLPWRCRHSGGHEARKVTLIGLVWLKWTCHHL